MRGKEKLDEAVGRALKTMNVPTRSEFKRALSRIESLEAEIASSRARSAARAKTGGVAKGKKTGGRSAGKTKAARKTASKSAAGKKSTSGGATEPTTSSE
jgi:hypothetical protein